jgi:flagellar hook-length control protein FliK
MMLNTVIQATATSSGAAAVTAAAAPAANAGVPQAQAQAADAQGAAAAQAPAQLFAAWLGDQGQAAALAVQAGPATESTGADAAAPAPATAPATPDGADDDGASAASLPQDGALLAAMAMPLMPLNPAQVAQAVQAAQPTRAQADAQSGDSGKALAVAAAADPASTGLEAGRRSASLPQAPEAQTAAARPSEAAPAIPLAAHAGADTDTGGGANPGANPGANGGPNTGTNGGSSADKGAERTANAAPAASADRSAIAAAVPSQPAASAPAPDAVKLAGPPTAWRQSLQEALGDRMNVQVGKGIEQAVIRLEPPQLGRIDIAIRHSAGTLEVNISATNGEVLRQLQTVSDNLRSDLSQRQFTEVAVTVTPAPKNGAAPFGDPQQGRGRQQGREQEDQQPGRALAEADNNSSAFSLGGRGQA